jgi:two-component system chemotaxis response regulator CheB
MAGVAVIHHWPSRAAPTTGPLSPLFSPTQSEKSTAAVLGIASSTGGPNALATILEQIPSTFPVPILIVQHISEGFEGGLAHWLNTLSILPVEVGRAGQQLEPGRVLIAPSGAHTRLSSTGRIVMDKNTDGYLHVPSADVMLASLAEVYGRRAMGVVLTGMGADGAAGLRAIFDVGGMTLAQDEESSVVFGMPKEAIALGGAQHIVPIKRMARMIAAMAASNKNRGE